MRQIVGNVASLSLMAVVTWQIGRAALVDRLTVVLMIASLFLLTRYLLNSAWAVFGGAIIGLLFYGQL